MNGNKESNIDQQIIRIKDQLFVLDLEAGNLTLASDSRKSLPVRQMESATATGYFTFLYDPETVTLMRFPPRVERLPAHILYVEIPGKDVLLTIGNPGVYDARIIPRINFSPDEFFLDFRRAAFIDTLDLWSHISLNEAIEIWNGEIILDYDFRTRQVPDPTEEDFNGQTTAVLTLPPYPVMDPEGWKAIRQIVGLTSSDSEQDLPGQQPQAVPKLKKLPIIRAVSYSPPQRRKL